MSQVADALMGIFGMRRLTCRSCTHSIGRGTPTGCALWCERHERAADATCEQFEREPGTDEGEE